MSFVNATLVLSIGETVEEVTDSGFLGTTPTLGCALIGDDALLQVGNLVAWHFCAAVNLIVTLVALQLQIKTIMPCVVAFHSSC